MSGRIPSRGSDQFVVRMPDGMRDRLRAEAEANGRSMNAEIVARLEESLSDTVKISQDDSFAYADGLVIGVLEVMELLVKDNPNALSTFVSSMKEKAHENLKSKGYSESVMRGFLSMPPIHTK